MSKKIVVVNAGPRKGWNTDMLLCEAQKGAESEGAQVERFDLFRLEKYTGCISCFGCKSEKFKGHCVCRDGLTPVLDAIRGSDGLIIGSPNYLSELTASFRALYERLIFQNLTYNLETPCCRQKEVPVRLIMTSNAPDTAYVKGHPNQVVPKALLVELNTVLDRITDSEYSNCLEESLEAISVNGCTISVTSYNEYDEWGNAPAP